MVDSITLGSPHVLRAHVWEIKKNPHPENGSLIFYSPCRDAKNLGAMPPGTPLKR